MACLVLKVVLFSGTSVHAGEVSQGQILPRKSCRWRQSSCDVTVLASSRWVDHVRLLLDLHRTQWVNLRNQSTHFASKYKGPAKPFWNENCAATCCHGNHQGVPVYFCTAPSSTCFFYESCHIHLGDSRTDLMHEYQKTGLFFGQTDVYPDAPGIFCISLTTREVVPIP